MKKSQEIIAEFIRLYQEFFQSHSKKAAEKILAFMRDEETISVARRLATHNPHPNIHQSFERDWEATITSLESWLEGKVDFSVPGGFLEDIKTWITEDFTAF